MLVPDLVPPITLALRPLYASRTPAVDLVRTKTHYTLLGHVILIVALFLFIESPEPVKKGPVLNMSHASVHPYPNIGGYR